ncbi:MAG: HIT domain-containing protein [Candidatus Pacearchaeota archaeon]|jgi:histidine triad (HIT) family protein
MLPPEQIKQIKEQIFSQLESWPESQRETAKKQINSLGDEELEEFLIKNNLIKVKSADSEDNSDSGSNTKKESIQQECIFCLINQGKIPSYKIAENKDSIAILEINPASNGHVLIIPKEHKNKSEIPKQTDSLAKQVAKKIKEKLNPQKIDIITKEVLNHGVINVLPIYDNENLETPRQKADEEQLKTLQKILEIKEKEKTPRKPRPKTEKKISPEEELRSLPKYPIRIP